MSGLAAFQKRMQADQNRIFWKPEHYPTLAKVYKISEEQVAKAVTPAPVAVTFPEVVTKSEKAADVQRSFRWTLNDGEVDRSGDIVVAAGVDLTHFKSNPIALYQHDPAQPIGTWSGVHADGGKLKGTLNLAPTALGEHVRQNIAAGVLKAASIGFVPIEFKPLPKGGFQFDKIELMETSVVSIPASRGSLRERSNEELAAHYREVSREDARYIKAAKERKAKEARKLSKVSDELRRIREKRAERQRIQAMDPDQHREYLNAKAQRKQERQAELDRIRGQR